VFPIFLFTSIPVLILFYSGEGIELSYSNILSEQKSLIGYRYSEAYLKKYKLQKIKDGRRYNIMVVGNSRVLKFRKEMFQKSFYNAGYIIRTINDYTHFIDIIPEEKTPDILLVSLDQFLFNNDLPVNYDRDKILLMQNKKNNNLFSFYYYVDIWKDLLNAKYKIKNIFCAPDRKYYHGLDALVFRRGFRMDGSMSYGLKTPIDEIPDDSIQIRIEQLPEELLLKSVYFRPGKTLNLKAIEILGEFLKKCKQRRIQVIAYLPPIRNVNYGNFIKQRKHEYLKILYPSLKAVCDIYGSELYDFTDPSIIGATDDDFFDELHGREAVSIRILLEMSKNHSEIIKYIKVPNLLVKDMKQAVSRHKVYLD
jgi:hypothetical protein